MSHDTSDGAELAQNLPEVDPKAQAAALLAALGNPVAMDALLENRTWTGGKSADGGSGWPTHPGDHRNESTRRGRGST